MFIEFKWNSDDDPFSDVYESESGDQTFLRESRDAHDVLGQITSYAAAQLSAQFRKHIFSVFILRDTARLLRWDRSGTIITEAFKYNECDIGPIARRESCGQRSLAGGRDSPAFQTFNP
jgi:hypothetical protein